MTFIATNAFVRTRCRDCGEFIEVGQQITSAPDGFRHGGCPTRKTPHDRELTHAR